MREKTVRRFRGNNYMKGRIELELQPFCRSGAIEFRERKDRNTCIIIVKEHRIDDVELRYLYKHIINENREIK